MNSRARKSWIKTAWIAAIIVECVLILYYTAPIILETPSPFLVIQSESMLPVIKPGNIVVIRGIDDEQDLQGKIIAYYNPSQGRIIVHRVIEDNDISLITKGDNSDEADFFQPDRSLVLGEMKYIIKI